MRQSRDFFLPFVAALIALIIMVWLHAAAMDELSDVKNLNYLKLESQRLTIETMELVDTLKTKKIARANRLIAKLFGFDEGFEMEAIITYPVKMTFYTLSEDECDEDPLTSSFGKSKVFMAALSPLAEAVFGLAPGDRFALVSHDGDVRAICVFWDRLNQNTEGLQVDIVSPHKEVAKWYGVKDGYAIKLTGKVPS